MTPEQYKNIIWKILSLLETVMIGAGGVSKETARKIILTIYKSITGDTSI